MKVLFLLTALLLPGWLPAAEPPATALPDAARQGIEQPPELEPDIRFWMRVYSQISTNEGFIHDQWNLGVVY